MRLSFALLAASALLPALAGITLYAADEGPGKIMRPVDGAALANGRLDVIATAPSGRLELDGQPMAAQQPFPNVLHAVQKVSPGIHILALLWEGGRKEIRLFSGPNPPNGFTAFIDHPGALDAPCTQCHEMSQRGRFRFKGGCFGCHQQDTFAKVHTHNETVLSECGLCHNAHGSTAKAFLLYPKETACRICHQ